MRVTIFFCLLAAMLPMTASYNILVTVMGLSGSHNTLMYRFGELLGEAGNNVTMLRGVVVDAKVPKIKYIKQELIYEATTPEVRKEMMTVMKSSTWNATAGLFGMMKMLPLFAEIPKTCDYLLDNSEVMAALKRSSFDVIVVHQFDLCSIGVAHLLGVKGTIQFSTGFMMDHHIWWSGAPFPVASVPSGINNVVDRMDFPTRFMNSVMWAFTNAYVNGLAVPVYTRRFRERFGNDFPSLNDLANDFDLFYCNSDNLVDFPRPTMPNTIEVGGFMMTEPTPSSLPQEWKKIVEDDATNKNGFILFSMGSVVDTTMMPKHITMTLFNVFRSLKQKVLWKFDGNFPAPTKDTNVILTSWMPQTDLLMHKNCKGFITHGGFNSVMESAYAGVPLIVMPMFADQYGNAKRVVRAGTGVDDDIKTTTEARFAGKIKEILTNPKYTANAKRLGRMFRLKPTNNREQAVKWVEFLAEFGSIDSFKSTANQLHLYQYFLLDILAAIFVVWLIAVICMIKTCRACCGSKPKSGKKNKKE